MMSKQNIFQRAWSFLKESLNGEEQDYTQGSIPRAVVLLAIPMVLELSMESIFAVVDIFFVGKLGAAAISTVGLTESVVTIVYSIAMGLSIAATAIVSRRVGEKNLDAAAHAGAQAIVAALVSSVVLSILGVWFAADILRFMGADQDVVAQGASYAQITYGGNLVIVLLFLINGIFRGAGNAAIAMKSLWLASILNIILDPIFIGIWGLKGAAIATVVARGTGVLYQCYYLFSGSGLLKFQKRHFQWDGSLIKSIVDLAWPGAMQMVIASGSWIVLAKLVAEIGGTDASAGYQLAIRNVIFFILPAWGLSNAAATLVGQNLGAGKIDRAVQSVNLTAKLNAGFMAIVTLLFILGAETVIRIFTKEETLVQYGAMALRIIGTGYVFYGIGMVMTQALNGAGDTRTPTYINLVCFWLFQIPLAYLLAKWFGWGTTGVFVSIPLAESSIALVAWYYFRKGNWKKVEV